MDAWVRKEGHQMQNENDNNAHFWISPSGVCVVNTLLLHHGPPEGNCAVDQAHGSSDSDCLRQSHHTHHGSSQGPAQQPSSDGEDMLALSFRT